jgi:hypothetical protein
MTLLMIAAAATAYACTLSAPAAVTVDGDKATVGRIDGLPAQAMNFRMDLRAGKNLEAIVTWPNSPLQIEGKAAALTTGQGGVAFVIVGPGPCLFTETSCISLVHLVDTSSTTATAMISPTAMSTDEAKKTRAPFLVSAVAQCTRSEGTK